MKKQLFNRLIAIGAVTVLGVSTVGCGSNADTAAAAPAQNESAETTEAAEPAAEH